MGTSPAKSDWGVFFDLLLDFSDVLPNTRMIHCYTLEQRGAVDFLYNRRNETLCLKVVNIHRQLVGYLSTSVPKLKLGDGLETFQDCKYFSLRREGEWEILYTSWKERNLHHWIAGQRGRQCLIFRILRTEENPESISKQRSIVLDLRRRIREKH